MNLAEVVGHWLGRVEIVLAGADDDLRAGQEALAAGDGFRARAAARRVLERAPDSPVGLALLADACDAAHLDAELAMTLEELARRVPSRAEVLVRLARARRESGASTDEVRSALLSALAVAESGSEARVESLLALADLDIAAGAAMRAELWLARIVGRSAAATLRAAEVRLLRGDAAGALTLLGAVDWEPGDGRAALTLGRARVALGDPAAIVSLLRAYVLDVDGASEALSDALARLPSETSFRVRVRSVVDAKGEQTLARWQAAFANAEGARDVARLALRAALATGEHGAARALLDAAIEDRDLQALREALAALPSGDDPFAADARALSAALSFGVAQGRERLDAAARITDRRAIPWAIALAQATATEWVPTSGPADWTRLLARLDDHAHALDDEGAASAIAELSVQRSTPVLLAVVGEFNAGKSTFINALVGKNVAPTGILPTTAVLHRLCWAPDSLAVAKIILRPPSRPAERFVAPADLPATLARIDASTVERVDIRLPVGALARVEILDTPGFNADVVEHGPVAWSALDTADVAVWLVDATQAIKQTERRVLEEAARRRLPVQVLVNKADRLSPDDVERVLTSVKEGLAGLGLASWRPPLAFSSKRALAGRLGDPDALRDSGWAAVQTLIEEGIVGQGNELKERALRRRARRVVAGLLAGYRARVGEEEADAKSRSALATEAARTATRIEHGASDLAARLTLALEAPARAWTRDQSMVFVGRDPRDRKAAEKDPSLERYRVESGTSAFAPTVSRGLAEVVPTELRSAVEGSPVRAIVRTAIATMPGGSDDLARLIATVCNGSIAALVEELLAFSVSTNARPPSISGGTLRELEAFALALDSDGGVSADGT